MKNRRQSGWLHLSAVLLAGSLLGSPVRADISTSDSALLPGDNPDFDTVVWVPLGCNPPGDPVGDENPPDIDMVGDATYPVAYFGRNSSYLFFRLRVNAD